MCFVPTVTNKPVAENKPYTKKTIIVKNPDGVAPNKPRHLFTAAHSNNEKLPPTNMQAHKHPIEQTGRYINTPTGETNIATNK